MISCVGTAPTKEVHLIDSLNQVAYSYRYKDLDSSCHAATQAYGKVNLYSQGKAEASNNLGFCAFMRMDFEKAEKFHKDVYSLTKNELELLVADIGLMKIYQRTAMNKEFYDYRNSALRRMKRIDEDNKLFVDKHERLRLNYARSEFYIVSAVYYYYLQQRPEAVASINEIYPQEELAADTNQLLYYHYIKGSAALCDGETADERRLREFDELYTTWKMASRGGYLYFEGNGVQGLANLMASPDNYDFFQVRRSHALKQFDVPVDSLLPMRLGQLALKKFKQYNDVYQIAGAYVSIGKYLNAHDNYAEALDTLTLALECVNSHHRRFYDCHDSLDWLKTYDMRDTISSEKAWIERKLRTVPEWISRIREQLSVTYAGLEMKQHSDYNRNIYLDILEDTRQDKELESRYQALESEARQLNILLFFVIVGFILVVLFFWIFNKRSKERNHVHLHRLRQMLDICQKITASIPTDAQTEEEIVDAILSAVQTDIEELFSVKDIRIEDGQLVLPKRLTKDEKAILHVIAPYITWALDNGMTSISLGDERRRLEKERYVYEQHIAGNKRQNLIKKACMAIVNGIHPYIDRIINEVHKLTEKGFIHDEHIKAEKYQYMDELVTTINEYNDILALWIKMKQGSLSLNIETFGLNELFDLIRKGSRAFEMKQQQLEVTPTDTYVKADKALTLFMINTLAENARKYTPKGGKVKVYANPTEEYVEISVEDTGYGLSEEDVSRIVGEKLYNSQEIGIQDAADREELLKNKGSGFGLMNCKGIIEKYRKTNEVFRVCLFNVESTLGKGSRFYFRLPTGVRKTLMVFLCIFFSIGMSSCNKAVEEAVMQPDEIYAQTAQDSLSLAAENVPKNAFNFNNVFNLFRAVPMGIKDTSNLVILVLVIGGALEIYKSTGAIDSSITKMVHKFGSGSRTFLLIALMVLFSVIGGFLGWIETLIPFAPLVVAMILALGYDGIVACAVLIIGLMGGFVTGPTNLYTVGVCNGILQNMGLLSADSDVFVGLGFRAVLWAIMTIIGVAYTVVYANRIAKDPAKSLVHGVDVSDLVLDTSKDVTVTGRHVAVLLSILAAMIMTVIGMQKGFGGVKWGIDDVSAVFLASALFSGIVGKLHPSEIANSFVKGGESANPLYPVFLS